MHPKYILNDYKHKIIEIEALNSLANQLRTLPSTVHQYLDIEDTIDRIETDRFLIEKEANEMKEDILNRDWSNV